MEINRNNYEAYFLDELEGKLSAQNREELQAFLLIHPDLAEELDLLRSASTSLFTPSSLLFPNKDSLKKPELPISKLELEHLLIGEVEGTLSQEELLKLDELCIQFQSVTQDRLQFAKTKLLSDRLTIPFKESLYVNESLNLNDLPTKLVALLEGDLTKKEESELQKQLASDNQAQLLFEQLSKAKLRNTDFIYNGKDAIKIENAIDLSNIHYLLVAKVEGDLDASQNQLLNAQLAAKNELRIELGKLNQTKLPITTISFEHKHTLYRKEALVIPFRKFIYAASASAAAIVLLVWVNYSASSSKAEIASMPIWNMRAKSAFQPKTLEVPKSTWPKNDSSENESSSLTRKEIPGVIPMENPEIAETPSPVHTISNYDEQDVAEVKATPEISESGLPELPKETNPETPEMKLVLQPTQSSKSTASSGDMTVLAYLGRKASHKIENTTAYSFAEKQIEKLSNKAKEEVQLDRIIGANTDKVHIKIGSLEVTSGSRKKSDTSENGLLSRVRRIYNNVSGK
jgi:hypothetical protein